MIKNYFITALRNLTRYKVYSLINILGLSFAIASVLLIFIYVKHETTYDTFHNSSDRIYRVASDFIFPDKIDNLSVAPPPLAPYMKQNYQEVEQYASLFPYSQKVMVKFGDTKYFQEQIYFADSTFFDVFKFGFKEGNSLTALAEPNKVVINNEIAQTYFASESAIGKVLEFDNQDGTFSKYTVTGVLNKMPTNTHIKFRALVSASTFYRQSPGLNTAWISAFMHTFVRLKEGADVAAIQNKILHLSDEYQNNNGQAKINAKQNFIIEPLTNIHLKSNRLWDITPPGNQQYIYVFSVVAFFLLIIACINYMNLATARASTRMKEIGIRKVAGAHRSNIVAQVMGETFVITFLAVIISVALAELALPVLNQLTDINFNSSVLLQQNVLIALLVLTVFVTLLAGSYPAFYISLFNPSVVLKGKVSNVHGFNLRKALVVFQFSISVILIIATTIVLMQINYMRTKDVGFNKNNVIAVQIQDTIVASRYNAIKDELMKQNYVSDVAFSATIPGDAPDRKITRVEGATKSELQEIPMEPIYVDKNYFDLMETRLTEGRYFSKENGTDDRLAFIVNEAAINKFGWKEESIGRRIVWGFQPPRLRDGKVIGVVEDIHTGSLKDPVEPMLFILTQKAFALGYVLIRVKDISAQQAVRNLQSSWAKLDGSHPMEYVFLDENLNRLYQNETKISRLFTYFSIITIIIACLGLLGLVLFSIEQRVKEIGIRKVLGAGVSDILKLISKEYVIMVTIAIAIASPVAFYFMNKWLQDFSVRMSINIFPFVLAGAFAMLAALLTVSFVTLRTVRNNPVNALKYE